MLKAPCWWGCSAVRGYCPSAPSETSLHYGPWVLGITVFSQSQVHHSIGNAGTIVVKHWLSCDVQKKKEINFKKKSACGVSSCGDFASALEGTPCCLQQVISLAAPSWPWCKFGSLRVKALNSGSLPKRPREACICWMYISRVPSNWLTFRGQIYTHLTLCKLCFHHLKIEELCR